MGAVEIITAVTSGATTILSNEGVQKLMCGTYSDGSPRTLPDALTGEFLSPEQKKDIVTGKSSSPKKKNKKDKGKKKKKKGKGKKKESVKFKL